MNPEISNVIPLKWYVEPDLCLKEQRQLLNSDIYYLGHGSNVSNVGDYFVLPSTKSKDVMVKSADSHTHVISNICRHRQAQLLSGKGNAKSIMCPIHRWNYGLDGQGLSAHHFDNFQCPSLPQTQISSHNDFIFKNSRVIDELLPKIDVLNSLDSYKVQSVEVMECAYNWKIFMETYLDVYHINSIHRGLRRFITCKDIDWEMSNLYSRQTVQVNLESQQVGSNDYNEYAELIQQYYPNSNDLKIHWLAFYPNLMIEIYPYNMVTSLIIPITPSLTLNVLEFLAQESFLNKPGGIEIHNAFKRSYLETAAEDDVACRKIQLGRQSLYDNNVEDYGPYQDPMELGIPDFYRYWLSHIGD